MNNPAAELIKDIEEKMSHTSQVERAMKCKCGGEDKRCRFCVTCQSKHNINSVTEKNTMNPELFETGKITKDAFSEGEDC